MRGGVLVVDKPGGMTSHDVVRVLRKRLKTREVGHAGTLDPMATGVLVIATGVATRLVPFLTAADKAYETTVLFGVGTDSLDADGAVTARAPVPDDWRARLGEALDGERARVEQIPPAISAIRLDGERAHERVRRGEEVSPPPRPVAVRGLEVLERVDEPPSLRCRLTVTKGYYVRAFARDVAARLGTVGHLTALRRIASGRFTLDDAIDLSQEGELAGRLLSLEDAAARALPSARLSERGVSRAVVGQPVPDEDIEGVADDAVHAWFGPDDRLVALGSRRAGGRHHVVRGFPPEA